MKTIAMGLLLVTRGTAFCIQPSQRPSSLCRFASKPKKGGKNGKGGSGGPGGGGGFGRGGGGGEGEMKAVTRLPKGPVITTVELGGGRSVKVHLPTLVDEVDDAELARMGNRQLQKEFGHLFGAGDIVWPSR